MRRTSMVVLFVLVAIAVALPAQAATYFDNAVAALKHASVYVAPGTERTNSDTANILSAQLSDGDNVAIVMLPAGAISEFGDADTFVQKVDEATGRKRIIGLSVGDQVVATSNLLPPGVAKDLMQRAIEVSTNTTETLITFIRNVHSWQAQHPEAVASKPVTQDQEGGFRWDWFFTGIFACIIGFIVISLVSSRGRRRTETEEAERIKFRSPDPVKDALEDIVRLRRQVEDPMLSHLLVQVCRDTEAYFSRARHSMGRNRDRLRQDTTTFQNHLSAVKSVLERYVDIQENPRYFDYPERLKERGVEAIQGFADSVLDSIKQGNRTALTNFRVDTDILSAQRYR